MNFSHLIEIIRTELKQIAFPKVMATYIFCLAGYLGCLMAIFPVTLLLGKVNASFLTYPFSLYSLELICTYYIARSTKLIPHHGWPNPSIIGHYNIVVSGLSVVITLLGSSASQGSISAFFIYAFYVIFVAYFTMVSSLLALLYSIIRRSIQGLTYNTLSLLILSILFLVDLAPISY